MTKSFMVPSLPSFNNKQQKIYVSLLELGRASMTELAKKAGIKRPTAYLLIEELMSMGLASQAQIGKRKIYTASHPQRLSEIARENLRKIEEMEPELLAIYNGPKDRPKIQVFEGVEGVMQVYREVYQSLSNNEEALWFTNIEALQGISESTVYYKKILKKMKNPRIRELNLGNQAGIRWAEEIKHLMGKNHFIRILPEEFEFGMTDTVIFGNKFVTFSLKKDIFVTVIESPDIATSYRALFEWAWKMGKTV